jgi:hypothetical protein
LSGSPPAVEIESREVGRGAAVRQAIAGRDAQHIEATQHVEVGEHQFASTADRARIAHRDTVEPTAATRPAGGRAELLARNPQAVAGVVPELTGERTFADARRIGLGDPDRAHHVWR